jgi:hypothetical protein
MPGWPAEASEVGPETGYSSIGGMLPYWVPPQGGFYGTRRFLLRSKFAHRETQYVIRCIESPRPQIVVSAMAGAQFSVRKWKSTQALFATP